MILGLQTEGLVGIGLGVGILASAWPLMRSREQRGSV
ncbi:MAG: hypothetical protein JWM16_4711 [Verrucomicrobiales bacterium]|nr:hypothetical protein [Verrucomicrobiales bacterium]